MYSCKKYYIYIYIYIYVCVCVCVCVCVFTQPLRRQDAVECQCFKQSLTWFQFRAFFLLDWLPY